MNSGNFQFGRDTLFDPNRWMAQIKHFMKCNFLTHLQTQPIDQDHILRGVILPTQAAVFWVGADGSSMLDKASSAPWGDGREHAMDDTEGCVAWLIPTELVQKQGSSNSSPSNAPPQPLWSLGRLHLLTSAPRTTGGKWRITLSPPSSATGNMTMMVTEYQGPLISVFWGLQDATDADTTAPAPTCTGPIQAALRWSPYRPTCDIINTFAGFFLR